MAFFIRVAAATVFGRRSKGTGRCAGRAILVTAAATEKIVIEVWSVCFYEAFFYKAEISVLDILDEWDPCKGF